MWSLALPFKTFSQDLGPKAAPGAEFIRSQGKVVYQGRLVFKVLESLYSVEDLKKEWQSLTNFFCLFPDSLIEQWMKNAEPDSLKIAKAFFSRPVDKASLEPQEEHFLKSLQSWIKLYKYAEGQKVKFSSGLYSSLFSGGQSSGCDLSVFLGDGVFEEKFLGRLQAELYLQSRFEENSFVVTNQEINLQMKSLASAPAAERKSRAEVLVKEKKRLRALDNFIQSLEKQISHEDFW